MLGCSILGQITIREIFYYKSILLGGQGENLYDPTDNSVISIAFRKAGRHA